MTALLVLGERPFEFHNAQPGMCSLCQEITHWMRWFLNYD